MEEEKKKPSKSAAHKEVAIVLSTMKWIDEHLSSLGQDRQNMKTAEAKRAATRAQAHKELSAKMDAKHSISVQYLQSLDYDKEIAPSDGKMTINGKTIDTEAVNDQVGLADAPVQSNTTGKLGRNETKDNETESLLETEARMSAFLATVHRRQLGRSVKLRGGGMHRLVEGDMVGAETPYDWHLWPFGEVPYTLHPTIRPCGKSTLLAAMFEIEKYTCVRFKELSYDNAKEMFDNKTSTSPLLFATGENEGCFAGIGYKKVYKEHNVLNIGSGCEYPGSILHMLLHNLGIAHEQARYDRDLFVNILWDNMVSEEEFKEEREGDLTGEFKVLKATNTSWEETSKYLEYDYGSISHFGRCEFSKQANEGVECEASMEALVDAGTQLMGNRQQLTTKDIAVINSMYGCSETCGDGVQNQKEEEKDCGGPNCQSCESPTFSKVSTSCPLASAWNKRMESSFAAAAALLLLLLAS